MSKWNTSEGDNNSEEYLQNITQFIEANLGKYQQALNDLQL